MQDMVLILDFDHRYAAAAALKLRAEGIYCRIVPGDITPGEVMELSPMGVLLAGSVGGDIPLQLDGRILNIGVPVLALGDVCYSLCLLLNGGAGEKTAVGSVVPVRFEATPLTDGLSQSERMIQSVRQLTLPADLSPIAFLNDQAVGFRHEKLPIYGLAFQAESNDPDVTGVLLSFAKDVCGCGTWWDESAFISAARGEIAETVGDGRAVCLLTGGLDSGVAATLAHRALGDRLRCVFVDTGLLRKEECERVLSYYRDKENLSILCVNAQEEMFEALKGLDDVQDKQRAFNETLDSVLRAALKSEDYQTVIRGINCNDLMRMGNRAPTISSEGKAVIAPLVDLFKEEIRRVGEKLGMPQEIYGLQPFPGAGLAVRVEGEATRDRVALVREADSIFSDEIIVANLGKKLFKYFAALYHAPYREEKSVDVVVLRAVQLVDGLSGGAKTLPARLPYDLLERATEKIMAACPTVRRVIYDLSPGGDFWNMEND